MDLNDDLLVTKKSLNWKISTFFVLASIFAAISLGSYVFYAICPTIFSNWFPENSHDYANGIPMVLASLAGIFFVYIAFLGQRWQMLFQQQEIRDNRTEMKASTEELKAQADALTSQISRMDRDFVHQNFFRILEQHFKTRDRVEFSYKDYQPQSDMFGYVTGENEHAFDYFFRELKYWINNDKDGWGRKMDLKKENRFLIDNGFPWCSKRPELKDPGEFFGDEFIIKKVPLEMLTKQEITFVFRAIMTDSSFGPYLRSCYYLFGYMMENNLNEYLDAVDAGMDRYERSFLFYQITSRFEVDNRKNLKHWLMDHRFLANIEPRHLLSPEHIELLYPIGSGPEFKKI